MTDKEAYELLVKYSDEKGLIQQREMIRQIGVEETAKLILSQYKQKVPDDFKLWMIQGLNYLSKMMSTHLN
jgi:hypothetical protein